MPHFLILVELKFDNFCFTRQPFQLLWLFKSLMILGLMLFSSLKSKTVASIWNTEKTLVPVSPTMIHIKYDTSENVGTEWTKQILSVFMALSEMLPHRQRLTICNCKPGTHRAFRQACDYPSCAVREPDLF